MGSWENGKKFNPPLFERRVNGNGV